MQKILLLIATLIITSACSQNAKKRLGLTETMPDEYQVSRTKALEVPPCYKKNSMNKTINSKDSKKLSEAEKALLKEVK